MDETNNDKDPQEQLEELVSPSDVPLIDLIHTNMGAICTTINIFKDRNPRDITTSLCLATILEVMESLFNVQIPAVDLLEFLSKYTEE